jgi:hypothetical protein
MVQVEGDDRRSGRILGGGTFGWLGVEVEGGVCVLPLWCGDLIEVKPLMILDAGARLRG